jgi:alanyl-tRNA synthetase
MQRVEEIANAAVREDYGVFKEERPLADAQAFGATTLLGEKYRDPARFVLINSGGFGTAKDRYSLELCGGTHIDRTGELLVIKILKDSSVSRGVRRIEGVAGPAAVQYLSGLARITETLAAKLSAQPQELPARVDQLLENIKELKAGKAKAAPAAAGDGESFALPGGRKLVVVEAPGAQVPVLRGLSDRLKEKHSSSVLFLFSSGEGKLSFVASCTGDMKGTKFNASSFIKDVSGLLGGSGGGRPDFAQGGGPVPPDMSVFKKNLVEIAGKWI